MAALRRTMAAGFTLADSRDAWSEVQAQGEALLRPVDSLFRRSSGLCASPTPWAGAALPQRQSRLRVGAAAGAGTYRVYGPEGDFLCLSRLEGGVLTSIKNFFGA